MASDLGISSQYGMDLFGVDVATGAFADLTNTPGQWDEQASYSPSGNQIIYASSSPYPSLLPTYGGLLYIDYIQLLRQEFWMMNADGSNSQQLTGFNAPLPPLTPDPEYTANVNSLAVSSLWNRDGTQALLNQVFASANSPPGNAQTWLLTFQGACGEQPMPTATATAMPTQTATATPTATASATAPATATPTTTASPARIVRPTSTSSATPAATITATPASTRTTSSGPTATSLPAAGQTPGATASLTATSAGNGGQSGNDAVTYTFVYLPVVR